MKVNALRGRIDIAPEAGARPALAAPAGAYVDVVVDDAPEAESERL